MQRLLKELALADLFEHIVSSAKKPARTSQLFEALLAHYELKATDVVSIGDNFINDVAPALLLGMKGIYIDPNRPEIDHSEVKVVSSLTEIF